MKKMILILLSTSFLSNMAFANSREGFGLTTKAFFPLMITTSIAQTTSDAFQNDLVQVEGDAIIALETGIISPELKSVVMKLRAEFPVETQGLQDIEVVEMLVLEN